MAWMMWAVWAIVLWHYWPSISAVISSFFRANMIWIVLLSCQTTIQSFQTIDIRNDEYALETRTIDSLTNPYQMKGTLGNMYVGGIRNEYC